MRKFLLLACLTLACGGDDEPTDPGDGNGDFSVTVANNVFTPSTLSVPVGSTVTWQWASSNVIHNVTFEDGPASANLGTGMFSRTFAATGDYAYVCTIHAAQGMAGTVSVTASTTGGGGTGGGGGGGGYP
ncbi:MAG TPA: plastocyanin/azurin family copper-binding protein [Gemmatimonadales bacterium]|jgi:plastocyanin|nr:plastocyanin/azurin family copper-binding protein [Gemmatimonadales bacterium]